MSSGGGEGGIHCSSGDNPDYFHSYLFPSVAECAFIESISYGHFAIRGRCCPTGVFFALGRDASN